MIRGAVTVLFTVSVTFGIVFASLLGFALPHNVEGVRRDDFMWHLLAGWPIGIAALQRLAFITCYRYDTPQGYLSRNEREAAKKALNLVYSNEGVQMRLK